MRTVLSHDQVNRMVDLLGILWILELELLTHNRHQTITRFNRVCPRSPIRATLRKLLPFTVESAPHFALRVEAPDEVLRADGQDVCLAHLLAIPTGSPKRWSADEKRRSSQ